MKKTLPKNYKFLVYKHTCTITNKSYIGYTSKTMEKRWEEHLTCAATGKRWKISIALCEHGIDDWEHTILGHFETKEDATKYEIEMIAKYDTHRNGYNSSPGGFGGSTFKGGKHTPQSIAHFVEAQNRPEQKLLLHNIHVGIPKSPEHCAAMREGAKHRPPISEETRQNLSDAQLIAQNRPEVKQAKSERQKELCKNPEYQEKRVMTLQITNKTPETKAKRKKASDGENNGMFGKTHSDEAKQKMSKIRMRVTHLRWFATRLANALQLKNFTINVRTNKDY